MLTILLILLCCVAILALLYLLAIMPRMIGKPDTKELQKWLYAHRGLHDNASDAPENSMLAFQKAVDAGYGIELDIQLSKDKIPVVFHDFTLKRICGAEGKVAEFTYEELQQFTLCKSQQKIPKFEDVLRMVDGRVPLIVEFKEEGVDLTLCEIADPLLQEYEGLYCMESFNPLCVRWYRKHHKDVVRGQLSHEYLRYPNERTPLKFLLQNLMLNFLTKPDFIAYCHSHAGNLSRRLCRKLYGNLAVAWTIKSEEDLAEARKHFDIFIFDSFIPKN